MLYVPKISWWCESQKLAVNAAINYKYTYKITKRLKFQIIITWIKAILDIRKKNLTIVHASIIRNVYLLVLLLVLKGESSPVRNECCNVDRRKWVLYDSVWQATRQVVHLIISLSASTWHDVKFVVLALATHTVITTDWSPRRIWKVPRRRPGVGFKICKLLRLRKSHQKQPETKPFGTTKSFTFEPGCITQVALHMWLMGVINWLIIK